MPPNYFGQSSPSCGTLAGIQFLTLTKVVVLFAQLIAAAPLSYRGSFGPIFSGLYPCGVATTSPPSKIFLAGISNNGSYEYNEYNVSISMLGDSIAFLNFTRTIQRNDLLQPPSSYIDCNSIQMVLTKTKPFIIYQQDSKGNISVVDMHRSGQLIINTKITTEKYIATSRKTDTQDLTAVLSYSDQTTIRFAVATSLFQLFSGTTLISNLVLPNLSKYYDVYQFRFANNQSLALCSMNDFRISLYACEIQTECILKTNITTEDLLDNIMGFQSASIKHDSCKDAILYYWFTNTTIKHIVYCLTDYTPITNISTITTHLPVGFITAIQSSFSSGNTTRFIHISWISEPGKLITARFMPVDSSNYTLFTTELPFDTPQGLFHVGDNVIGVFDFASSEKILFYSFPHCLDGHIDVQIGEECDEGIESNNCSNCRCVAPDYIPSNDGCTAVYFIPVEPPIVSSTPSIIPPATDPSAFLLGPGIAAVIVPIVVVTGLVIFLVIVIKRKHHRNNTRKGRQTKIELSAMLGKGSQIIPYSELKFLEEIGVGAFGKVFVGEYQKTRVALKISNGSSTEDFLKEASILVELRHPNIVQYLGISVDDINIVLVMEYCDGGSLDNYLFSDRNIIGTESIQLLSKIAKGILYLHKNNVVHRDLAARNILLSKGEPKLSDFGLSRKVESLNSLGKTKAEIGPIRWMAPESLRQSVYSTKTDVWSFGIVCFEVFARMEPHVTEDQLLIAGRIRDEGLTPGIPANCDPVIAQLMKECWHIDPFQRPDVEDIVDRIDNRLQELLAVAQ